ncbi:MAG: hypothetical protein KF883_03435 [Thermomicrobiales bacterium]|nr:hypothetical protein [Thermomicrobiales bacterium]
MDDRHFDHLTRLVGRGASRRTILKTLLGIGGGASLAGLSPHQIDAREARTRPTVPPPPPPATTTSTTAAPPLCPGQDQCPNSTLCCPTGTCARSGNQAICCPSADRVCGRECCTDPTQCCDRECCGTGHTCLTQVFAAGPNVQEESCCPTGQTCDNQCCQGTCYDPNASIFPSVPEGSLAPGFACCPAGSTICAAASGSTCCGGDTPQCCVRGGVAICIAANACCNDIDCPGECAVCDTTSSLCVDDDGECPAPDACTPPTCIAGACSVTSACTGPNAACCGDSCTDTSTDRFNCGSCGVDCTVEIDEDGICCNGVCESGPFCGCDVDGDCDTCETCNQGACLPIPESTVCQGASGEICCTGLTPNCCDRGDVPVCLADDACCEDGDCPGDCSVCVVSQAGTSECVAAGAETVCRPSIHHYCDPVEMCDGQTITCPADQHKPNGEYCDTCRTCLNGDCLPRPAGEDDGECGVCKTCDGHGNCVNRDDGAAPTEGWCCGGQHFLRGECCADGDCDDENACLTTTCNLQTHRCTFPSDICEPGYACEGGDCLCNDIECRAEFDGACCEGACVPNLECCSGLPCDTKPHGTCCDGICTELWTKENCSGCGEACIDPPNGVGNCGPGVCGIDCNPGYVFTSDRGCVEVCEYAGGVRMSNGSCARSCSEDAQCRGCGGTCDDYFTEGSFCGRSWFGSCQTSLDCPAGSLCSKNSHVCWEVCAPGLCQLIDCSPPPTG